MVRLDLSISSTAVKPSVELFQRASQWLGPKVERKKTVFLTQRGGFGASQVVEPGRRKISFLTELKDVKFNKPAVPSWGALSKQEFGLLMIRPLGILKASQC